MKKRTHNEVNPRSSRSRKRNVQDNGFLGAQPAMIVNETPHTTPSHTKHESGEEEGDVITLEGFLGLPIEIQVIILQYLEENPELLSILCQANKSFNELVTPILYANIDLRPSTFGPDSVPGWRICGFSLGQLVRLRNDKILQRQKAYITTVRKHPEYLAKARHLAWAPTESGWTIFSGMINIRSINLSKGGVNTDPTTIVPVFPNLRSARLSGGFSPGSLKCILLTSPYLTELHLDEVGEGQRDDKYPLTQIYTLIPFLDLCSSTPGSMPDIKILTLSRKRTGSTLEPLQPALESWARFLRQYADRLEVLTLELFMWDDTDAQDAFKKHIVPLLKSGEFKRLKQIELLGATRLTPEDSTQIKGVLPSEVNFLWTPVFPVVASSSIPEYGFISPSSSFESLLPGPPTSGYLAPELGDSDYPPATGPSYYD